MNPRWLLLLLILALVAAGTWWLAGRITSSVPAAAPAPTHTPDYYFSDATVTTLDSQGRRAAVMTAPRIEHHPDDDSSEVFAPRITYYTAGDPPWQAQADHGLLPSGGQLVKLNGHVVMHRPGVNDSVPLVIRTEHLDVNLDTNVGTTDAPVSITHGASSMTGVGMLAYFKDNRLILQSQVRGHYVRQK